MGTWDKTCAWCGTVYQWNPKDKRLHYCSDKCRADATLARLPKMRRKPAVEKQCALCGTSFADTTHSQMRRYCGNKCARQAVRNAQRDSGIKSRTCVECGKTESARWRRYCSTECIAAANHRKTPMRPCKRCGVQFRPDRGASAVYCSKACSVPVQPEACKLCGGAIPPPNDRQRKPNAYCSDECRHEAQAISRAASGIKSKKARRAKLAIALRMMRKGASLNEIADAIGIEHQSICGFMLRTKAYRRKVKRRKDASKWHEVEASRNCKSKQFRIERDFLQHATQAMQAAFDSVRVECQIPGSRRKIDMVVCDGLFRFGVELKNGNRTARLDQTLGQAIVKCVALGGLQPVCIVPDDVKPDKVFMQGCASVGAICGNLTNAIEQMRVRCCK